MMLDTVASDQVSLLSWCEANWSLLCTFTICRGAVTSVCVETLTYVVHQLTCIFLASYELHADFDMPDLLHK